MLNRLCCFILFFWVHIAPLMASDVTIEITYSQIFNEPFTVKEHGQLTGIIPDYMKLLEEKIPVHFMFHSAKNWSDLVEHFEQNRTDILPGVASFQLAPKTIVSKPFLSSNLVLAGFQSETFIESLADVEQNGSIVAVEKNSPVEAYVKTYYPYLKVHTVQTIYEGLLAVEQHKADFFLEMSPIIGYLLQKSGFGHIKVVGILKDQLQLVIALNDSTFLEVINHGIDSIKTSEKNAILKRYLKVEIQPKTDYGPIFKIIFIALMIIMGFSVWLIVLKREIKKRKQVEEKLTLANQQLKNATADLKIALTKTAQAHQIKSQFLANISHEIRTPMNTIIGVTELMLRKELPEKERHNLSKVAEAGHHLLDIINDILDFSKIEANKITLESISFQLEELIISIINMSSMAAHQKGLELLVDLGNTSQKYYKGDPLRLKQILLNLVSNAIKFTEQGEIIIRLHAGEEDAGIQRIRFEIHDTGIGIKPEQMENLFIAFSQADMSITRKYGGTGLGLSIAQGLAIMMQGEINCTSQYGKGSTFYFEIPLEIDLSCPLPLAVQKFQKAPKVLVVDDNISALEIFTDMLAHFDVHCHTCKNAHEALELLQTGRYFDVAIIDWKMDSMDGVALFSILQHYFKPQITSIIMVTAYDKEELVKKLGTTQPYTILVKPITSETLFHTLANLQGTQKEIKALPY